MLLTALQYSLIITFIFVCYTDGMILAPLRRLMEKAIAATRLHANGQDALRKPLFDCSICMSGFYTILIWVVKEHSFMFDSRYIVITGEPLSFNLVWLMCCVGGINVILSPFIEGAVMDYLMKITREK